MVASVALSDKLFHKMAPSIKETPFTIIGKHSGDKESVNITANHDHDLLYPLKIKKCYV